MQFAPLSCVFGSIMNFFQIRRFFEVVHEELAGKPNATENHCPQLPYTGPWRAYREQSSWPLWMGDFVGHSFYFSYSLSQLPGGYVADRWGAKHLLGTSMVLCVFATSMLPLAIHRKKYSWVLFLRILESFSQGPVFPSLSSFIQNWTYINRPLAGSLILSGLSLGTGTSVALTEYMLEQTEDWSLPFYIWAGLGGLWYVFYMCMVFSSPVSHPFILDEELEYFEPNIEPKKKFSVPWGSILHSKPVWVLFFANFCEFYTSHSISTLFPKYLLGALKWDTSHNAIFTVVPFLSCWLTSILISCLANCLIKHNISKTISIRRVYGTIVTMMPSLCCLAIVYMECDRNAALAVFITAWCSKAFIFDGMLLNVNDLTMYYPGTVMGITNGLSSTVAILANWITSKVSVFDKGKDWVTFSWILFGLTLVATLFFLTFAQAERQPWDFRSDTDIDSL